MVVERVDLDGLVGLGLEAVVFDLLVLNLVVSLERYVFRKLNVLLKVCIRILLLALLKLELVLLGIALNPLKTFSGRPLIIQVQLDVGIRELEHLVVEFLELLLNGLVLILVLVLVLEFVLFELILLMLEANVFLNLLALIIEPLIVPIRCSRLLGMISKSFLHSLANLVHLYVLLCIELSLYRCLCLLNLLLIKS